jgi:hypothetical protein
MSMECCDLLWVNLAGQGRLRSGRGGFSMLLLIVGADSGGKSDGGIFNCIDDCWRLVRKFINANGCRRGEERLK